MSFLRAVSSSASGADASAEASRALEATILRQLLSATGAFRGGSVAGSSLRAELFIDVLAEAVAQSGGLGLAQVIAQCLDPQSRALLEGGATAPLSAGAAASQYARLIAENRPAAFPLDLALSIAELESGFDPEVVAGGKENAAGAGGLFQILRKYTRDATPRGYAITAAERFDPAKNTRAALDAQGKSYEFLRESAPELSEWERYAATYFAHNAGSGALLAAVQAAKAADGRVTWDGIARHGSEKLRAVAERVATRAVSTWRSCSFYNEARRRLASGVRTPAAQAPSLGAPSDSIMLIATSRTSSGPPAAELDLQGGSPAARIELQRGSPAARLRHGLKAYGNRVEGASAGVPHL